MGLTTWRWHAHLVTSRSLTMLKAKTPKRAKLCRFFILDETNGRSISNLKT
jgi:hypothetical protein